VFPGIAGSTLPFIPIITDAVIASGEKVVASQDFRERFSQVHRKVAAIDMESYGVACAAERRGARLTVIKGISDFADATKNDDYHEPAARASAQVFAYPVREGIFGLSFNDD
jgi:nucleoside phosphorylase